MLEQEGGIGERVISPEAAGKLIYMMHQVVERGTGRRGLLQGRQMCGGCIAMRRNPISAALCVTSGSLGLNIAIFRLWSFAAAVLGGEYRHPSRPTNGVAGGFVHGVSLACHPIRMGWAFDSRPGRLLPAKR